MRLLAIFVVGYLAIVFEHPRHLNKAAPALLGYAAGALTYLGLAAAGA